jgi:hypothetical protein
MADLIEREPLLAKMWPDGNRRLVEEAPAIDCWIKCSERLPEKIGEYLTYSKYSDKFYILFYYPEYASFGIYNRERITHWVHLPNKPER